MVIAFGTIMVGLVIFLIFVVRLYLNYRRETKEWEDYMARLAKVPNLQTTMDAVIRAKTPKDLIGGRHEA